jgi:hypothetical protein
MGEQVSTTDLYEGTYYLLHGCELVYIEGVPINGSITCKLTFQGEPLSRLQLEYFSGKANVPLFEFRRTFGQVNALVREAKKKAKGQYRQGGSAEGDRP